MAETAKGPAGAHFGANFGARTDPGEDSRWVDEEPSHPSTARPRWRQRLQRHRMLALWLLAGLGLLLWLGLMAWLAHQPHLPGHWQTAQPAGLVQKTAPTPGTQPGTDAAWLSVRGSFGPLAEVKPEWLPQAQRWTVDAAHRLASQNGQRLLNAVLAKPQLRMVMAQGESQALQAVPRGWTGLGAAPWALGLLGLSLWLAASVAWMAQPGPITGLFALLAATQALGLALISLEWLPGLGTAAGLDNVSLPMRWVAEVVAAAAMLHLALLGMAGAASARRLAGRLVWALALVNVLLVLAWPVDVLWWWLTASTLAHGLVAVAVLKRRQRDGLPPVRGLMALAAGSTAALLALILALLVHHLGQGGLSSPAPSWAVPASTVCAVLQAALLLRCLPLSAEQRLSLWPLRVEQNDHRAEQLFESLYRSARALEQSPQRAALHVTTLLREVFEPLELSRTRRTLKGVRVARDGITLAVPVPVTEGDDAGAAMRSAGTIVLRHARQGRRLFNEQDRQLTERMLEQLRRAVAYDRAVERGRTEERTRIAQDLHDDIGARLLTLMYKAPNSEIEEYIRHTLQDLKTLTRGLAAANPRLSHAAAEWKADIAQRLYPVGCDLHWAFSVERDITLNVVQWSGITRVLRELVNNIISHAQATQVDINAQFDGEWLSLSVADDGLGRSPAAWSHGLGLGGVRKRVKLLGGQVNWDNNGERGIRCEVRVLLGRPPDA